MKYGGASQRREAIKMWLRANGYLEIPALARDLQVSEMTVRRDLQLLANDGELHRLRAGASLPAAARGGFARPASAGRDAKQRIGLLAAGLIGQGDVIAIDAGSTAFAVAEVLPLGLVNCVVTGSLPVLQLLAEREEPPVIALGGELHRASRALTGARAIDSALGLRVNHFFAGAASINASGVYINSDTERTVKRALMTSANQVVLLAEARKFGTFAPVRLCQLEDVHVIVTSAPPPPEIAAALDLAGVSVKIAH
jgi:DeoR/GlpR family transcriptional regulator of sugar metabolism